VAWWLGGRARMARVMEAFRRDSGTPLGEFLRGRRRVAGWTQRGLADAAGLSVGVVRDLEQGVSARPRQDSLERLAAVLGMAPEEAAGPSGLSVDDTGSRDALSLQVLGSLVVWRDGVAVPLVRCCGVVSCRLRRWR
jgi:transcriptional regulator with XRE-family HTH domain